VIDVFNTRDITLPALLDDVVAYFLPLPTVVLLCLLGRLRAIGRASFVLDEGYFRGCTIGTSSILTDYLFFSFSSLCFLLLFVF
jgi:hypothetical protein